MIAYPVAETPDRAAVFLREDIEDLPPGLDCDCSVMTPPDTPRQEVILYLDDVYFTAPGLEVMPLTVRGQRYFAAYIPSTMAVSVLNAAAFELLQQFWHGRSLPNVLRHYPHLEPVVRRLCQAGLLTNQPLTPLAPPQRTAGALVVWLHVTNRCNLACTYCYIQKSRDHMSAATGQAAVDASLRAAREGGYTSVILKYAGGEPTLALPAITRLHGYAQAQMAQYGVTSLRGVVLSNGVGLTAAKLARLQEFGLEITISLDGLAEVHDAQRPTVNGSPSANHVMAGIRAALALGMTPTISVTVTQRSTGGLIELVRWLLDYDVPFHLHFYRQPTPVAGQDDLLLEENAVIEKMWQVFRVIEERLPRRSVLKGLVDYADMSYAHQTTCAMGHNYLVFDHQGALTTCQMLMSQPVGDVHAANPLALIRSADIPVRNTPVDEKEGCQTCSWRYWCAGGCPVQTFRQTGRTDVKSPNCRIYKALYPGVIRLEALRLIHYGTS